MRVNIALTMHGRFHFRDLKSQQWYAFHWFKNTNAASSARFQAKTNTNR